MVFEILPKGEANSVRPERLAKMLGIHNTRTLRRVIEKERAEGALILSAFHVPGGYYRPADGPEGLREIKRCYMAQKAHALAILRRLESLQQAAGIVEGQLEIRNEETKGEGYGEGET